MYYSAPRWWHRPWQDKAREESDSGNWSTSGTRDCRGRCHHPKGGAWKPAYRVQVPCQYDLYSLRTLRSIIGLPGAVAGPNNTWTTS